MVIILMGVSGCGKSTVGRILSDQLNIPFYDGDDFHPGTNVIKMESGIPLDDGDREPWLRNLSAKIEIWNRAGGAVLACSALKKSYRDTLRKKPDTNELVFIYLKGSKSMISKRLEARSNHYMPAELLDSQFEALEEPDRAIIVSIKPSPEEIAERIRTLLAGQGYPVS